MKKILLLFLAILLLNGCSIVNFNKNSTAEDEKKEQIQEIVEEKEKEDEKIITASPAPTKEAVAPDTPSPSPVPTITPTTVPTIEPTNVPTATPRPTIISGISKKTYAYLTNITKDENTYMATFDFVEYYTGKRATNKYQADKDITLYAAFKVINNDYYVRNISFQKYTFPIAYDADIQIIILRSSIEPQWANVEGFYGDFKLDINTQRFCEIIVQDGQLVGYVEKLLEGTVE